MLQAAPCGVDMGGRLLQATSRLFGVSEKQLQSSDRLGVSEARWALAYVLVERVGWSYSRVARLLHKDHTAVLYGHRKAQALRRTDPVFCEAVQMLEDSI